MKKELVFAIGGFLAILGIGFLFLLFSAPSNDVQVSGSDALKIAFAHSGYWVAVLIGIAVSVYVIITGIVKGWYGSTVVIAGVLCGLFLALCLFTLPVKIKTDPISSGATTEEINYLKTKGLK